MRFTTTARRGAALVAAGTATALMFAGCSAGSLGSSSGGGASAGAVEITWLHGAETADVASAKALSRRLHQAPTPTSRSRTTPGREARRVTTWSRPGWPPATCPTSSSTTTARCCRRSNRRRTSPRWTTSRGWASSTRSSPSPPSPTARSTAARTGRRSAAACSTTSRSTRSWVWRSRRRGTNSWPTTPRSRPTARRPRSSRPTASTWTSQLFVLGDFHNVAAAVPSFAADYTANKAKYATTPAALAGFENIQKVKDAGYFNKDFASAKLNDGIKAVATGTAAHYPQLGGSANTIENVAPGKTNDVGFFALPGNDAATNGMTVWPGTAAMYIPKSVEGAKLEAAKKFVAFAATQEGCDAYAEGRAAAGPVRLHPVQAAGRGLPGRQGHARPTSRRTRPAPRWSSCRRSRARPWSRSASRSAPVRWTARRAPSSTTRTSRSRPSSSACRVGTDPRSPDGHQLRPVRPSLPPVPIRDRRQAPRKGLRRWRAH